MISLNNRKFRLNDLDLGYRVYICISPETRKQSAFDARKTEQLQCKSITATSFDRNQDKQPLPLTTTKATKSTRAAKQTRVIMLASFFKLFNQSSYSVPAARNMEKRGNGGSKKNLNV
jgi:hypothetical protein